MSGVFGRRPRGKTGVFGALAFVSSVVIVSSTACSTVQNSECDCLSSSLQVTIPPESASIVASLTVSGTACQGVTPTCVQNGVGGCSQWLFEANAAGTCHIDMTFASGTAYAHDVTIIATNGCCAGFYADPTSAGTIAVTPPGSSAGDAGDTNDAEIDSAASPSSDASNADAGDGGDV